jgi:hypothetical protein
MKIKVPEARQEDPALKVQKGGPFSQEETSSTVSPPVSTPTTPTSVDTELEEDDRKPCARKTRAGRKRPRPVSTARKPKTRTRIARLVSQDFSAQIDKQPGTLCVSSAEEEDDNDDESLEDAVNHNLDVPASCEKPSMGVKRCVSVLDGDKTCQDNKKSEKELAAPVVGDETVPPLPNPLYNKQLHDAHVRSMRLEKELAPMRVILSKLMNNLQHNRRGIFNAPVDPVALGLPDYERIVPKPMDLGTIKAKLHALAYSSRAEVAEDIRLVFRNAILYNPQEHPVHGAARSMLGIFEAGYLNACQLLGHEVDVPPAEPFASVASVATRPWHCPLLPTKARRLFSHSRTWKRLPTKTLRRIAASMRLPRMANPRALLTAPMNNLTTIIMPPSNLYIQMGTVRCRLGFVRIENCLRHILVRHVSEGHVLCAIKDVFCMSRRSSFAVDTVVVAPRFARVPHTTFRMTGHVITVRNAMPF